MRGGRVGEGEGDGVASEDMGGSGRAGGGGGGARERGPKGQVAGASLRGGGSAEEYTLNGVKFACVVCQCGVRRVSRLLLCEAADPEILCVQTSAWYRPYYYSILLYTYTLPTLNPTVCSGGC